MDWDTWAVLTAIESKPWQAVAWILPRPLAPEAAGQARLHAADGARGLAAR